ncbi:uncharacterized protein L201_002023 [Kwoniella dendrophila CBS 6074]|uniref:RING-type domain-containing protein n=1 Tax=Kwoniella dendrophila CBS 6074 TaxID=1295534 RepID=A0AAX4JP43_9TREE
MSDNIFPSTSSYVFELNDRRYDIDQIEKGLDAALEKKANGVDSEFPTPPSHYFHLHTCTIETTLEPPQAELRYWARNPQPNPAYTMFQSVRNKLSSNVDPFVPLDIATSNNILLPCLGSTGHQYHYTAQPDGVKVYLPGANKKKHLAIIESLPNSVTKEWIPTATAWDMQNWLHATIALDPTTESLRKGVYKDDKRRFALVTSLKLCWVMNETSEEIDLKLLVTINVFVNLKSIVVPLPEIGKDMLGLILHSLIPSSTAKTYKNELKARSAALAHFYASLKPAPDLPFNYLATQLQPKEMVSKLLPFQTRTVKLLLEREQGICQSGTSDPTGFWKAYDLGQKDERVAFRRLTGDLALVASSYEIAEVDRKGKGRAFERLPDREADDLTDQEKTHVPAMLDLSGVKGTMLCEEMGLGKTVEAIALVLLHRHPLSRLRVLSLPASQESSAQSQSNSKGQTVQKPVPTIDLLTGTPGMEIPEIKKWVEGEHAAFEGRMAWDEEAQLNVTEVATTLIVSPPSLLKQWVSEMQRHAPTLRVCVYEGWKSLQKGVEKQRAVRLRAAEAEKKRKAVAFRDQTRTKYTRTNANKRVKVEPEVDQNEVIDVDAATADKKPEVSVEEEGTLQVTQRQFVEYVRAHDIVVTTYQSPSVTANLKIVTVQQDLKVALPAPSRSRRSTANYKMNERPRSPLVMVEWWRVIMDEVQLAGDHTEAAKTVSLIPRVNSLAVSGTPARADIRDLMGSLRFLRVPVIPYDSRIWHRLQQPSMRLAFEGLFQSIAVRTTKKEVSGEFNLPHQTRYVVPIELSEIELHYYNDTLERFKERLHIPRNPTEELPEEWVLDRALFHVCLRNLRQICTHIQVGQMGEVAGPRAERRLHLGRALMTMTEALEKMRNDHTQEFLIESRKQMRAMIKKAQLTVLNEADGVRHLTALNLYEKVKTTLTKQLGSVREHLKQLLGGKDDITEFERDHTPDRQTTQQEKEKSTEISIVTHTIRDILIVLHQAWFFEGDVRHMLKEEEAETNCYAQADLIRKEILKLPLHSANLSIGYLQRQLNHIGALHDVSELQMEETDSRGGMLSNNIINQANDLLDIMNDNAYLVFEWRAKILALLSSPIDADTAAAQAPGQSTEVVDPEAEYYAEALKAQGEVEAYMMAFAAAIGDRREFLLENRSLLVEHESRQKKQRSTKAAINALADSTMQDVPDDVQLQATELMQERQAFRDARAEKGYIIYGPYRREEIIIATKMAGLLKTYIKVQAEYVDKLDKELDLFQATFNRRVKYFAALQEISDSVTAPEFKDLNKAIDASSKEIDELEVKLARMVVKGRYLQYLGSKDQDHESIREDCIICFGSSDDNEAVLLECGHYFCLSCFKEYRKSPMGRKCPSCRMNIDMKEVARIKLNSAHAGLPVPSSENPHGKEDADNRSEIPTASQSQIPPEEITEETERDRRAADLRRLKMIDIDKMRAIMGMDMLGEFGSKINFLVKHLLFYKSRDPDARHVIFSNWSDSLNIVMQALRSNDIKFVSFDEGRRKDVVDKFLKDESIKVFLLHAEKESSGLTLTSCKVVHLLEPVLRHSFELQAIGRVDRLGQNKETSVYCYATLDTVESRILSQGVRNGTSIYLDEENADQHVADMPNVASAATRGGDVAGESNEEDLLGLIM